MKHTVGVQKRIWWWIWLTPDEFSCEFNVSSLFKVLEYIEIPLMLFFINNELVI
jgi:hypothetical protein